MEINCVGINKELFGVYHQGAPGSKTNVGVVILSPIGHEQIRSYTAIIGLAEELAMSGIHVMRFDYMGTGDSIGEFEEATFDIWKANAREVIQGFNEALLPDKLIVIGLRFGAAIAAECGQLTEISELILWHPIYDGLDYLEKLRDLHSQWLGGSFLSGKLCAKNEILGFRYSEELINEISSFRLGSQLATISKSVVLLDIKSIMPDLDQNDIQSVYKLEKIDEFWLKKTESASVVPKREVDLILNHICHAV